jgi:hypothetical protein
MAKMCSVSQCAEKHKGLGFCDKHLRRFKRHGDPLGGGYFRDRTRPEKCAVDGCEKAVLGRG